MAQRFVAEAETPTRAGAVGHRSGEPAASPTAELLLPGDPLPHFTQRTRSHPRCAVDFLGGRYLLLCFFGSAGDAAGRAAVEAVSRHRDRFDDRRACFFGITVDPEDEASGRVGDALPGVRFLFDFDRTVSRLCGALPRAPERGEVPYHRFWMIVDPTLHVLASFPFQPEGGYDAVFAALDRLPEPARFAGFELPPPVPILPNVFEPALCRRLIDAYEQNGGEASGVMREGARVLVDTFKRRKDYRLTDAALIEAARVRLARRVAPEIERLFAMRVTRIERHIVGCYAAEDGGRFLPHRDNASPEIAHRRFAVSINLNGDFDGGELCFPEYGPRGYKAPPGWAVVFPGGILHAVTPVTRGRRYAFLPFVYDEAAEQIRQAHLRQSAAASTPAGG